MTPELQAQHDRTDAFMAEITQQITMHQFDTTDQVLLKRMVEEGFSDTRGVMRLRFAETLGQIGEPATPVLLEAVSSHPNEVVRRASAKTLTLIGDPTAVPTLLHAFLNDPDQVVRSSSVGALARTGEVSVPPLLDILASETADQTTKGHAAWALAFIGAEATEYLTPALNSDSLDVRCAVIGAIVKVVQDQPSEKLLNILISALTDPEPTIRNDVAAGMAQINSPETIPHLILACRDSDVDVRKAAVSSLGKVGDESALETMRSLLNDDENVVRVLAKVAISQLEQRLADDDWD
ncbi:HEAT repeat domain-containing protein [filamentous cyanobacterium LEGE 11480]|uniref:HEAT repeat domain-containing protein n=2 Tax=Romeriopsis TaxID=2992131 RepID=A0A928VN65_9CYAN|nr:HEAT repeat domain-containing protein [Romeriopsis navalis LEGE 11480]